MYDVIIIGAGPGGIFSAYELTKLDPALKIAVFEGGHALDRRHCPIDGEKIKSCVNCKSCSIMSGFGGAGAFSDGKYNITNDFGGTLYEYIGKAKALELMKYVDDINMRYGGEGTKLYSTAGTHFKTICIQNKLNLLDASVRHLGTDKNYVVLENLYELLKDKVDFHFDTPVQMIRVVDGGYEIECEKGVYTCEKCIVSVGRSGSKWMESVCRALDIPTQSNRVDIGVRVELPAVVFEHVTSELYEGKIVYRTEKFEDTPLNARTMEKFEKYLKPGDDVGILIDLGHMNIRQWMREEHEREDFMRVFRQLPMKLRELHVSDNKGRKDEHREVGYGNLPLADVAAAVKAIGFDGIVTVEIVNSQNWTNDEHIAHAIDTSNRCFAVL